MAVPTPDIPKIAPIILPRVPPAVKPGTISRKPTKKLCHDFNLSRAQILLLETTTEWTSWQ